MANTRRQRKTRQPASEQDKAIATTEKIEKQMRELPAPLRLYLLNRLLDSLRLPTRADVATAPKSDSPNAEPTASHFFVELSLDNIISIRAEWERAGVEDYLRGSQLAVGLLGLAEDTGQPLELGWKQSPLVKGDNRAKVSYVVGLDDSDTFVPLTTLPAMWLDALPEKIRKECDEAARSAEQVFRTTFARHLHIATRQLLDQALESLSPMKKKTIRLLEAYTSPTNYSWFKGAKRGGDRTSRHQWTDDCCKNFAKKTKSLLGLWKFVIAGFRKNDYDPGFLSGVANYRGVKNLLPAGHESIPADLLEAVKRTQRKSGPDCRPLAFAMQHARQELGIPQYAYDTLKEKYDKGQRLLKQQSSTK